MYVSDQKIVVYYSNIEGCKIEKIRMSVLLRTWAVSSFGCWENTKKLTPSSCLVSTVPLLTFSKNSAFLGAFGIMWCNVAPELWDGSFIYCLFPFSWWRGWGLDQRGCAHDSKGVGLRRPNSCILSVFLSVCLWFHPFSSHKMSI